MAFQVFAGLSLFAALAYAAIMVLYHWVWNRMPRNGIPAGFQPKTRITVLIPARNEAANIGSCLQSILDNHYPSTLLEIIVIDDHSDDDTAEIVIRLAASRQVSIRLLRLAELLHQHTQLGSFKKKALELGVEHARGELILSTDADCWAPSNWLWYFAAAFEQFQPMAIAGPVLIRQTKGPLQVFQALDTLGMMLMTGAGIQLGFQRIGNGANLAYTKRVFLEMNGYEGNAHLASGDDVFLLQKIARKYPKGILFLKNKDAAVHTAAVPNLSAFIKQRLRWGGKASAMPEWQAKLLLALIFTLSWCILLALGIALFHFSWKALLLFAGLSLLKAVADYLILRDACVFFDQTPLLRHFTKSFVWHTLYIAFIGLAGLIWKKYEWKGRRVQ